MWGKGRGNLFSQANAMLNSHPKHEARLTMVSMDADRYPLSHDSRDGLQDP